MTLRRLPRRQFLRGGMYGLAAAAVAGCVPSTTDPGDAGSGPTLRLPGAALGFPSPFAYIASLGYTQASFIYDTLLWKDADGELLPWLARGFERSDDGQTYAFQLREGVRWHDGRPLTAHDVVFTFRYYADNTLGPLVVVQPQGVTEVEALDDHRVRVQLVRPDNTFAEWTAGALPIVPEHVWSEVSDPAAARDRSILVGSGPYRLESYAGDGGALLYVANDDYFLGRPFVPRLEVTPVGNELTALRAGHVDAGTTDINGARPEVLAPFRSDASFGVIENLAGFTFPLFWNLHRTGPLADGRVRRACAMAIDRDDVVARLTGGNGLPGNPGFLPPDHPFHVAVEQYPADPAGARALLDGAGYGRLRFELLFPGDLTPLAQIVIEALGAIDVELVPRAVELGPALFARKLAGEYDMAITLYPGPSGPGPGADPDMLRLIYSSLAPSGLNHADGYANAEFDQLAQQQLSTLDDGERRRLVGRMQQIVAADVPVLPLYYSTLFHIFRRPVFDSWYWTPGGFPSVGPYNRHAFVTGATTGL